MDGTRHVVAGAGGVPIGLLTAGTGPALLLVHGGMGGIESWARVWDPLAAHRRVTAMDRRGRGTSGDADTYALTSEYDDVAAVATALARDQGAPVDVVGHSIGATCVLGAAARGAPFRRIVLYEPPGPQTVGNGWADRMAAMVTAGQIGRAVFSFLTEVVGYTDEEVAALRDAPGGRDVLPVAAATLPREARALTTADLPAAARHVTRPVRLLLGTASPPWAAEITRDLAAALPDATVTDLPDVGHEALDQAPDLLAAEILRFLG